MVINNLRLIRKNAHLHQKKTRESVTPSSNKPPRQVQRDMGQGQSQSDKGITSSYSRKSSSSSSKGSKKGKRRSSSKTNSQHSSQPNSSHFTSPSSSAPAVSNGRRQQQLSVNAESSRTQAQAGSVSAPRPRPSAFSTTGTTSRDMADVNHQRGSFSAGGERSAPSRQFSLTRQPPSSSSSSSSSSQSAHSKHSHIEKYFNKYKDIAEESILAEGMERFCVDLGVDPTEFIVLVLAWKFEASQMCRFTKEEFMNGCQKMQAHNAKSLRERFPDLLSEAKDKKFFKDLYNFTFSFGLDHSSGQRSLPIDMAVALWELVFTQQKPDLLDRWFTFLKQNEVKGISRDTWNMFLPFVEATLPDLSNYDESEAWPSLFDDFVEGELSENTMM